jgi:hypothetical protein
MGETRFDADQRMRRRRFNRIMVGHLLGFGLAAVLYFGLGWTWAAVVVLVVTVPLHWVAMLVGDANPPARARSR